MDSRLAWGIIGTGHIARVFAQILVNSKTGNLVAVGSRSHENAERFGAEFQVPHRHGSYEDLLSDEAVEAVYIAVPHSMHAEWAIKAAEAGKHILCEKPLALNHAEAMAIVEAALRHDVFLMEAFMYRCHPQTMRLVELIRSGAIGQVRVIQASFGIHRPFDPKHRLFANELAGGGILDLGCYCVSMARLLAGAAAGKPFLEPTQVVGLATLNPVTGTDDYAIASLKFPNGILAQLSCGTQVRQENAVRVYGSGGNLCVPWPWQPGRDGTTPRILLEKPGGGQPLEILIESPQNAYAYEADMVAAHVAEQQAPPPAMTWADSLGNMKVLDSWRQSAGMVYEAEKPEAQRLPVHKRPLAVRKNHNMKYGRIPGIDKPVSRLMMGADNQVTMPHAAVMFDDFFEAGGNSFDTAYIYRQGVCEKLLGHWISNRGIRDRVVILDKGAHTPFCTPKDLTQQLFESLERLRTDYVDLYMLHRDNPDVPVGEFIDVLNEHKRAGRIRAFGVSNWTLRRIEEANAYARSRGLAEIVAVSNNFSLARMVQPPWGGCVASSDTESKAWFTRTQMPLVAWSSQARGFFAGAADPSNLSDKEMVRCWYSEDNFRRLERVRELATRKGVLPINIALAYVLCQPFPTFPIIGPRTLEETRIALRGLDVELTPQEMAWLNLEGQKPTDAS